MDVCVHVYGHACGSGGQLVNKLVLLFHCGGLNDNGPHRRMYLNTWSSVGRTFWEGLGVTFFF